MPINSDAPFNPSDPRGSIASLIASRFPGGALPGVGPSQGTLNQMLGLGGSGGPSAPATLPTTAIPGVGPSQQVLDSFRARPGPPEGLSSLSAPSAYGDTGGNSPGVTVTPGITPSNYSNYFPGQSPTSAADPASISNYPQYTSTAGPGGNTSWMGNAAAGSLPFNPAMTPSTPDVMQPLGTPNPIGVDPLNPTGLV